MRLESGGEAERSPNLGRQPVVPRLSVNYDSEWAQFPTAGAPMRTSHATMSGRWTLLRWEYPERQGRGVVLGNRCLELGNQPCFYDVQSSSFTGPISSNSAKLPGLTTAQMLIRPVNDTTILTGKKCLFLSSH